MKALQAFFQKPAARIGALVIVLIIVGAIVWTPLRVLSLQAQAGRRIDATIETHAEAVSHFLACQMPLLTDLPADEGLSEAVALLERARGHRPFQAHTHYLLGRAYCLAGDPFRAIDALNAFIQARPKSPKGRMEAAYAHLTLAFSEKEALREEDRVFHEQQAAQLLQAAGYGFEYFLGQGQRAFKEEAYPSAWLFYRTAAIFAPLPADAAEQLAVLSDAFGK